MFKKIFRYALHIVWPTRCSVCGRLAVHVCDECVDALLHVREPFALACGTRVYAGTFYDETNKALVHDMKYHGKSGIGVTMGRALGRAFAFGDVDAVVPVPLHIGSDRGYNQSAMIARGAAGVWGVPVVDALCWKQRVARQATKGAERVLPGDAIVSRPLAGKRVAIVDDVCTSGSTIAASVRAAEKAGGVVVCAVVWSCVA